VDKLAEVANRELERWEVPGVAVAILHEGKVEAAGFGITSLETRQPVTAGTLFQIGSISKVYTAMLAMRLVEAGQLDLDTPVATYLPDLALADEVGPRTMTLRHFLSHTSGLEGDRFEDPYGLGDDALGRAVAEFKTLRQLVPAGELWTYCNTGFSVAGAVIERVTGKTFEAAMREQVLDPLKLSRSFYFAHEAITYPVAVGHSQPPGEKVEIARNYLLPRYVNPAGGIISTVEDQLRFALLHLDGGVLDGERFLSEESTRQMQTAQTPAANFAASYGLGWAIYRDDDVKLFGHGGSTNGFQAQLTLAPGQRFAIAQLTNGDRGTKVHHAIEEWALEHYCGIKPREPEQVSLSDAALGRFVGRYQTAYTVMDATVQDGGLHLVLTAKSVLSGQERTYPPMVLKPIGEKEFIITEGEAAGTRADFIGEDGGRPRFLRVGGRLAAPVADEPPSS
jgi:CubicO group peptidase (beta-lactamase class C family)